jgi:heat induced stress protein YflT
MATRTITRLYDSYDEAARAVQALEAAGVPHADISVVGRGGDGPPAATAEGADDAKAADAGAGAATGATLGTLVGGGAGLLAGIGALAIPGIGPIVAAGWLVAALTGAGVGAAAGGLLGSLTGAAGVDEADAHVYAEGVRRGGAVLTARVDENRAAFLEGVLASVGGDVDLPARRAEYEAEGWDRFDPAAPGYTDAQVAAERKRRVRVY